MLSVCWVWPNISDMRRQYSGDRLLVLPDGDV